LGGKGGSAGDVGGGANLAEWSAFEGGAR